MKKFIIIDGNAILHRAWHALPPTLTMADGTIVNAVYGFTSIMLKVFADLKPDYVAVAWDTMAKTFRDDIYADYKGTRVTKEQELYDQIDMIKSITTAFGIPNIFKDGFEADDVIGTLAQIAKSEKNLENIIVTGDLDILQLVDDKTKVYALKRGISDVQIYDAAAVEARYGLQPEQMIDFKALKGDASDNIKGVKGIGEKSAQVLIATFGTLENLYQAIEGQDKVAGIKPSQLTKLQAGKDDAKLAKKLVTIKCDVPLKFKLADAEFGKYELGKVVDILQKFEFKSLISRLPKQDLLSVPPVNSKAPKKNYAFITTQEECEKVAKVLGKKKLLSFDTETTGINPFADEMLGISISYQANQGYYILATAVTGSLKKVFANKKIGKVAHNAKFDLEFLQSLGMEVNNLVFDTKLAAYLLNPGSRDHGLKDLTLAEFGYQMNRLDNMLGTGKNKITMQELAKTKGQELADYACADADYTGQLMPLLEKRLAKEKLDKVFAEIELPLIKVLVQVESHGVLLDVQALDKLSKHAAKKISKLEQEIYELAGEEFNIGSPKQLQVILFEKLALPTQGIKKTKQAYSTSASELDKLAPHHPIISLIGEYREFTKLKSTYIDALPLLISPKTGRLHTSFNQTVAATGRLSSQDPNLQNIPIRTEEGRKIRQAFIAPEGYKLVSCDYSQFELRIAASLSKDPQMMAAFTSGEDIHRRTAATIFEVDYEKVTDEQRYAAKAINFGVIYGQGAFGLSQTAKIPYVQAKEFIDAYFKKYPLITKFLEKLKEDARQKGYAQTLFGRKRYLPEINSGVAMVRAGAERIAVNMPIQGTQADLLKMAMIDVQEWLNKTYKPEEVKMLLTVHDELVFEVREDLVQGFARQIDKKMENPRGIKLNVPIKVDTEAGPNWGEMEKLA